MAIDIEKLKAAAIAANQAWMDEPYEIEPALVIELIERLEAAERDAARYRLLRRGQQWSVVDGIGDILRADTLDNTIDAAMQKENSK